MISAMYENGGNTTHRFLDGHPELFVYPFESQLGNSVVMDFMSSMFPYKYRWPDFPTAASAEELFEMFFDEEMKTRTRVPHVSKFRDADLQIVEKERKEIFVGLMKDSPMVRADIIYNFFNASFKSWKNIQKTSKEKAFVGYSPIIGIDGEKILTDFPDGHVIHVVRNPWSGYSDTKKRPYPLPLKRYAWSWSFLQHMAIIFEKRFAGHFHVLRFEDLVTDPKKAMSDLVVKLGLSYSDTLLYPSWNGTKLEKVYPWGTIRIPTPEVNIATMNELTKEEKLEIRSITSVMLERLGYENFLQL
jgi:hypothetical protein